MRDQSISIWSCLQSIHYHNVMGTQSYNQISRRPSPVYVLYMYIFITPGLDAFRLANIMSIFSTESYVAHSISVSDILWM